MPTYVYKFVETGETIEVQQSFTDDTLTEVAHPTTGQVMAVKKVFQPVGVTFRGSGFFRTDSRAASANGGKRSDGAKGDGDAASSGSSSDSSDSGDSSGTSKAGDTTSPASGSSSSSASSTSSASAPPPS